MCAGAGFRHAAALALRERFSEGLYACHQGYDAGAGRVLARSATDLSKPTAWIGEIDYGISMDVDGPLGKS
jgi:hypothetical protein